MGHKGIYGVVIAGLAATTLMPAPAMAQQQDRVSGSEKGSLLCFSKFEVRWNSEGDLVQDTFITMSNDSPDDVTVQFYIVNGDRPVDGYEGWNNFDVETELTGNQPFWWALGRESGPGAFQPVTTLQPGDPPGRPANDGTGDYYIRGFVYGWAVTDDTNLEIKHNHLSGTATLVNYVNKTAWEYNAWAFARLSEDAGDGSLDLDGDEYVDCYSQLLINFQAAGSVAYTQGDYVVMSDTDVTLHPTSVDLRMDGNGPILTKAHYDVWNENETKLSGAHRCVWCWDQTLLSDYGIPNHFTVPALQSDHGKARIDGLASSLCDEYGVSTDAAMLGVIARHLTFSPAENASGSAASGTNMIGMGHEAATVQYMPLDPPPEAPQFNNPFRAVESLIRGLK